MKKTQTKFQKVIMNKVKNFNYSNLTSDIKNSNQQGLKIIKSNFDRSILQSVL